ncbi:hypothetical protein CB0940_06095 [Cercospora beticola]|uniref:Uncharacterized protein n=1 Tax=Cercospora beticola TaxID=122368 RepID=A0A2G5HYU4_CERBT|nr:hypothetical protein CB0940_06095 [Cercospora beticola]PIA97715.1 hypothetical protein CB0940_06095 [Cercospora beticola]WPA98709.1 hypothetical protein RHO25_003322 [Cercospora beticola]CAK1359978.1 unnamed protein product [Cercospora beticola]
MRRLLRQPYLVHGTYMILTKKVAETGLHTRPDIRPRICHVPLPFETVVDVQIPIVSLGATQTSAMLAPIGRIVSSVRSYSQYQCNQRLFIAVIFLHSTSATVLDACHPHVRNMTQSYQTLGTKPVV